MPALKIVIAYLEATTADKTGIFNRDQYTLVFAGKLFSGGVSIVNEKKKLMSIGVAAKCAGISTQSLQYYLMLGLLEATEVTESSRRMFDASAVDRIKLIKKLNTSGYPLRAIRELFIEGRIDSKGSVS